MRKWIYIITALAVLIVAAWSFMYLRNLHPMRSLAVRLAGGSGDNISMQFKGVHLIGKSKGKKVFAFKADGIDVSRDRQRAIFRGGIQGNLFQNEKPAASIFAEEVMYGIYDRNISIPGEAVIDIIEGPKLHVKNVSWNERNSRMICKGGFEADIAGSTITGRQMTADLNAKMIKMSNVSGSINLEGTEL